VIVNVGGATAADVTALMEEMKRAVKDRFGVDLTPEIRVLG
jgi:UDP-N-acetylmuramate dehydrogenase